MDPNVALIVGALAAAVANQAKPAVQDAYNGLKGLIVRKFGNNSAVPAFVDKLEQKPDSEDRQEMLAEELEKADAGKDPELVAAAQQLQQVLNNAGVNITVSGNQQIGGKDNVQQNIGQVTGGTVIGRQKNTGKADD